MSYQRKCWNLSMILPATHNFTLVCCGQSMLDISDNKSVRPQTLESWARTRYGSILLQSMIYGWSCVVPRQVWLASGVTSSPNSPQWKWLFIISSGDYQTTEICCDSFSCLQLFNETTVQALVRWLELSFVSIVSTRHPAQYVVRQDINLPQPGSNP